MLTSDRQGINNSKGQGSFHDTYLIVSQLNITSFNKLHILFYLVKLLRTYFKYRKALLFLLKIIYFVRCLKVELIIYYIFFNMSK